MRRFCRTVKKRGARVLAACSEDKNHVLQAHSQMLTSPLSTRSPFCFLSGRTWYLPRQVAARAAQGQASVDGRLVVAPDWSVTGHPMHCNVVT